MLLIKKLVRKNSVYCLMLPLYSWRFLDGSAPHQEVFHLLDSLPLIAMNYITPHFSPLGRLINSDELQAYYASLQSIRPYFFQRHYYSNDIMFTST